jgi:hypothetical protein
MKRMLMAGAFCLGVTDSVRAAGEPEPQVLPLREASVIGRVARPSVIYSIGRSEFRYEGLKKSKRWSIDELLEGLEGSTGCGPGLDMGAKNPILKSGDDP